MDTVALVPTYNEEKNIREVVTRLKKLKVGIVVIDDGSEDKTHEIAKKLGVKVIRHAVNGGKGEAIKTGFDYVLKNLTKAKYIVLIDADMQYMPEQLPRLLQPLKKGEADFSAGARNWSIVPFRHRLGNFVWKTSFNILFGTHLSDTNCGYMALTRHAVEKVKNVHGGYIIENKMLIDAIENGLRIKQVPVTVMYKRRSTVERGIRIVAGVLVFIITEGIKYRLGIR